MRGRALIALAVIVACSGAAAALSAPTSASRPESPAAAVHAASGRITVVLTFGLAPGTSSATSVAGDSVQGQPWSAQQGHTLAPTAARDSFVFASAGKITGYAGIKACNAFGCSPMRYRSWGYANRDTLVPVRVYAAMVPSSVRTNGRGQWCYFAQLANGSWYPADPRADTTAVCRAVYDTIHLAGGPKLQLLGWSGALP